MKPRLARALSRPFRRSLPAAGMLVALALAVRAQLPEGWAVTSNFASHDAPSFGWLPHPGDGGLSMFHPTQPSTRCAITGLAQDLTGTAQPVDMGASAVAVRASDGALVVGEHVPPNGDLDVHVITLVGAAVAGDIKYYLGAAGPAGAQVAQLALLPNEDVLVGVSGVVAGPMANRWLGVLDTSTGIVTPVPLTPPAGGLNAMTADDAGTTAYFAAITNAVGPGAFASQIWSVPIASGGAPTLLLSTNDAVLNLAYRAPGDAGGNPELVVASLGDAGLPNLLRLDLVGGGAAPIVTGLTEGFNGVDFDPLTGDLLAARDDPYTGTGEVYRVRFDGSSTLLWSSAIDGAFGEPSGLAIRPPATRYGIDTPGASTYGWAIAPNPGGLPLLGNAAFTLTVTQSPGTSPGFVFTSLAPASFVAFGVLVLIDLGQQVGSAVAAPPNTVPLPIPAMASLAGLDLYLQGVFADPLTTPNYAASDGLRLTLIGTGCP